MNLRDTMKRAADEEQLKLKPLPKHLIASQPELLRLHYALLLTALLSAQETISETQTRLTSLLLDALLLGDIRGALFEQARDLDEETPIKAARLIRDAGLARHLLVDALILLRLDAPLDDEIAGLINEFASFLDVDAEALRTCSKGAAAILGLSASRSVVAAKQWPGTFPFIGKPVAPKPIRKRRSSTAKPKAPVKAAVKKPFAKKIR
jgi:hypothetical protein